LYMDSSNYFMSLNDKMSITTSEYAYFSNLWMNFIDPRKT
jgi:hypothetical protein